MAKQVAKRQAKSVSGRMSDMDRHISSLPLIIQSLRLQMLKEMQFPGQAQAG